MPLDVIATLRELIATPSVNPMGRNLEGAEFYEHRLTDYLQRVFGSLGLAWRRQTIAPLRDNIVARFDGDPPLERGGAMLMFEVHQDTVPTDDMTIPPFEPAIVDGRMYGRGACDIKAGMAAMLSALSRVVEQRPTPRPTIVMACTVNEEHGFSGAMGMCRAWTDEPNPLLPRKPDGAVIAEPTSLNVVVAHKGMVRWRCHTLGRTAHSSNPQLGENAIFYMAKVLAALETYQRDVVGTLAEHPLCGRPTLSVGVISGGLSVNTVPGSATIEIDRRLNPGEDPAAARQHVIDYIATATQLGAKVQHEQPMMQGGGLKSDNNAALAERLVAAVESTIGRRPQITGVPFGTDGSILGPAGVPSVVFGPGSIAQAHTPDEWVPLDEVAAYAEVLYRLVVDWMGGPAK